MDGLGRHLRVAFLSDPNQITSGTLAYAIGAGCAIVSTRYLHAAEALGEGRGLLVDFRSSSEIAAALLAILGAPIVQHALEEQAYAYGREATWPRVSAHVLVRMSALAGRSSPAPASLRRTVGVPAASFAPAANDRSTDTHWPMLWGRPALRRSVSRNAGRVVEAPAPRAPWGDPA